MLDRPEACRLADTVRNGLGRSILRASITVHHEDALLRKGAGTALNHRAYKRRRSRRIVEREQTDNKIDRFCPFQPCTGRLRKK